MPSAAGCAGAGRTPTVGDLAGNADLVVERTRGGRASAARTSSLFPELMLTGYPAGGPGAAALVRRRVPRRRSRRWRAGWPTRVSATSRSSSATSTAARAAAPRVGRPAGEPQNAAAVIYGGDGRRALRQAPPAELRRVRRVPLLRARRHAAGRRGSTASTSPSRSARTSGRRAARSPSPAQAEAGLVLCINGSPYERNKDDVRLDARTRSAPPRPAPPSPTSTWSAARTSWSSTATR